MSTSFTNIPGLAHTWKPTVPSVTDLPTAGNEVGDARITQDTTTMYVWNGTTWVASGGGGGSGTVTQVNTGTGLTGGPVTTTGTISVATNGITNSLLAQMPTNTIKGNNTGGTANAIDLTTTQVATMINNSFVNESANIIYLTQGGKYATAAAAMAAASTGYTIVAGPGSWGDVTLKPGVDIFALNPQQSAQCLFGVLTFSPSSGTAAVNTVNIANIYMTRFVCSASAPVRINTVGCRIVTSDATANPVIVWGAPSGSSFYLDDGQFGADSGHTGTIFSCTSAGFLRARRCVVFGADRVADVSAGFVQFEGSTAQYVKSSAAIISVTGGFLSLYNNTLIENTGSNASGISVGASGNLIMDDNFFNISSGSGFCVSGSGTVYHTLSRFSDTEAAAANTAFQNTLTVRNYKLSGLRADSALITTLQSLAAQNLTLLSSGTEVDMGIAAQTIRLNLQGFDDPNGYMLLSSSNTHLGLGLTGHETFIGGFLTAQELSAAPTVIAGYPSIYPKTDGNWYIKQFGANEKQLLTTQFIDGGAPSSNYVASQILTGGTP